MNRWLSAMRTAYFRRARGASARCARDAHEDAGADGDGEGQEARVDFGLVPVRLDFDLGERLITLDRLRTLAPARCSSWTGRWSTAACASAPMAWTWVWASWSRWTATSACG